MAPIALHQPIRLLFYGENRTVMRHVIPRLSDLGFKIHAYDSFNAALKMLDRSMFHLFVMAIDDTALLDDGSLELALRSHPRVPVYLLGTQPIGTESVELAAVGVQGYSQLYPGMEPELGIQLRCAVERHRLRRERKLIDASVYRDDTGEFRAVALQAVTEEIKSASMIYAKLARGAELPDFEPA